LHIARRHDAQSLVRNHEARIETVRRVTLRIENNWGKALGLPERFRDPGLKPPVEQGKFGSISGVELSRYAARNRGRH
jgi:hypothetical protein